jgi:hypothetical protein
MPVLVAEKLKIQNATAARIGKLVGVAFVSAALSTIISSIFRNSISRMTSHVLFIAVVAAIALILRGTRRKHNRFDAGLVFVLFLFEPVGRILLRLEAAPANIFLVLPLAMVAAFFFGREGPSHEMADNARGGQ